MPYMFKTWTAGAKVGRSTPCLASRCSFYMIPGHFVSNEDGNVVASTPACVRGNNKPLTETAVYTENSVIFMIYAAVPLSAEVPVLVTDRGKD